MEYDVTDQYWIWLSSVEGVTPKRMYGLLDKFEDAKCVWENISQACRMLPDTAAKKLREARNEKYFYALFSRLEEMNARAITRLNERYPPSLTNIYDPPATLYAIGEDRLKDDRMFAIVGSRVTSSDGKRAALEMSEIIASHAVTIVSGMAAGIDAYAHTGCLNARGKTVAVLGCGVDVVYPRENARLRDAILETGGEIISEYPPATRPYAANFPARNRIISGLCEGVLMVEGKRDSGAMITVDHALDQGKDVFAVPGSVYSLMSEGPNKLIRDGAGVALSGWDILEHYRWGVRPGNDPEGKTMPEMDENEKIIFNMLRIEQMSFDEMLNATGFNSGKLNSLLTILELRGIIKQLPGRIYRV